MLEHLDEASSALHELRGVLKRGKGYVIITVPWLYQVYNTLSAIVLRSLTVLKYRRKVNILLRVLFSNLDHIYTLSSFKEIKRRRIFSPVISWFFDLLKRSTIGGVFLDSEQTPEEIIFRYCAGTLVDLDINKVFMTPNEWASLVESAEFSTLQVNGFNVALPFLNLSMLRVEKQLPDKIRTWLSRFILIAALRCDK